MEVGEEASSDCPGLAVIPAVCLCLCLCLGLHVSVSVSLFFFLAILFKTILETKSNH